MTTFERLRSSLVTHVNAYMWFAIGLQWLTIAIGNYYQDHVIAMLFFVAGAFFFWSYGMDKWKEMDMKLTSLRRLLGMVGDIRKSEEVRTGHKVESLGEPIKIGKQNIDWIIGATWLLVVYLILTDIKGWYNYAEAGIVYLGSMIMIYAGTHEVEIKPGQSEEMGPV